MLAGGTRPRTPHAAGARLKPVVDPKNGIERDARVDLDGFRNTLKLRAEIEGQWAATVCRAVC
jgi:hypothetical protein